MTTTNSVQYKSPMRIFLQAMLNYAETPATYMGLCYILFNVKTNVCLGTGAEKRVRKLIHKLYMWNMIDKKHRTITDFYWPLNEKGNNIRIAILRTWLRYGGMKDKKTFQKHLKTELKKFNLVLSDLTNCKQYD